MVSQSHADVAIIGAGIIGLSVAFYLARNHGVTDVVLIDQGQPMAFTSAQSGENYRNWWPHPLMTDFTNRSIDLMEEIAKQTGNRIAMTRRGYVLATRKDDIEAMLNQLAFSLGDRANELVRFHKDGAAPSYQRPLRPDWHDAPDGFDVLQHQELIRSAFPSLDKSIRAVLHIRRAGDISSQQLGQFMLEHIREAGGRRLNGMVTGITHADGFTLRLRAADGTASTLKAARLVNAAGPFAGEIAEMLDLSLPLYNVMQQKIAFEDTARAIPRELPFSIDLDPQWMDWTEEERAALADDPALRHFATEMPGAIHCRPDGGDHGKWIKLGWAYNTERAKGAWDIPTDPHFPEIVLRGAARLHPALKAYYGKLPRNMSHYGGWYTRTDDNWPLIGPMGIDGAFMACALSGHGTMTACSAGELTAAWLTGGAAPHYAKPFSLARYSAPELAPQSGGSHGLL